MGLIMRTQPNTPQGMQLASLAATSFQGVGPDEGHRFITFLTNPDGQSILNEIGRPSFFVDYEELLCRVYREAYFWLL